MDNLNVDDSRRSEIALRNQRRDLGERDHKLMMFMFGVLAYSAFANSVVGVVRFFTSSPSLMSTISSLVLGVIYAVAAHHVWTSKSPRWWLIALPAVLTIGIIAATLLFSPIALALNIALLAVIPFRVKVQRQLASLPT
ncbi:hypothetical protein DWU98_15285 [Dyella monticola]|uniref:Uncharacterized protein n=1 Tax=Dyella monticola TaxID=1927958 RepID=A0A370WUN8_9GAMM|nr:hypothetical protein [Dyella monticola]RDS79810.1 hypothetical protein DWU98_15285 [Dyella monticola]